MSWWDRYRAWQLESRARYIATELGLRVLIVVLAAWIFFGTHPGQAPLLFGIGVVLGIVVLGRIYYPRSKAKSQHATLPARTTHS